MKIAFYKGKHRIFDRLVQWWTRSPYSHCELVFTALPGGMFECASSSKLDGGVRFKTMKLDHEHWDLVEVSGDAGAARDWFMLHTDEDYDVLGLVGFVLPIPGRSKKWFCSEAIAAALGYSDPWRFSPGILYSATARRSSRPDHS